MSRLDNIRHFRCSVVLMFRIVPACPVGVLFSPKAEAAAGIGPSASESYQGGTFRRLYVLNASAFEQ
jgi:hypothetical protein